MYRNNRGGSLDEVHQFSSSMVLDSRFGLIYHPFGLVYPGSQNFNLSSIGISSTGLPYASFPGTSMSDSYAELGFRRGWADQRRYAGFSSKRFLPRPSAVTRSVSGFEGNLIRCMNVQESAEWLWQYIKWPSGNQSSLAFDRRFTPQKNSVNVNVGADAKLR